MWGDIASAAGGLLSSYLSSESQKDAASSASSAQTAASTAGITEQRAQFEAIQKLLKPYTYTGTAALGSQQALLGLSGNEAQQAEIDALENSAQYKSTVESGENAILQNASATGGLRGGNVQGALAQFRPQVLSSLINQQFSNLGSLSTLGQNSAVQQAAAGQATGNQVSSLLGNIGSAQAGNALAQGQANSNLWSGVANTLGTLAGSKF